MNILRKKNNNDGISDHYSKDITTNNSGNRSGKNHNSAVINKSNINLNVSETHNDDSKSLPMKDERQFATIDTNSLQYHHHHQQHHHRDHTDSKHHQLPPMINLKRPPLSPYITIHSHDDDDDDDDDNITDIAVDEDDVDHGDVVVGDKVDEIERDKIETDYQFNEYLSLIHI